MAATAIAQSRKIIVAGGGIAGLTAALAFAARGFSVELFERSAEPLEIGAGIQISPNATRILEKLGVLDALQKVSTKPEAVVLRSAATLAERGRVPLGEAATKRWGAPYIVLHRADLLNALHERALNEPNITLAYGATVRNFSFHSEGVTASVDCGTQQSEFDGALLAAADGVWSGLRQKFRDQPASRFSGRIAWRATIPASDPLLDQARIGRDEVTAFLHPSTHLIAYPVRAGSTVNLVAVTRGARLDQDWSARPDKSALLKAIAGVASPLAQLVGKLDNWTAWPIHVVDALSAWTLPGGAALIGDAPHAMPPFAAQGAAAAIEDAYVLAGTVTDAPHDLPAALARYERIRSARVTRIAKRGAFNEFAYHASGPVAFVRDRVLGLRSGEQLAADLDWLYGWNADEALSENP